MLRELANADAPSLLAHLSCDAVCRYIAPPPRTLEGFKRFVRWTRSERRCGRHLCFGIFPRGQKKAIGVLQIWPIEPDFSTAEWGFVLGRRFWGNGIFPEAAELMLRFAFETLDVRRLEARAVDVNARGNGALRKLGARQEGRLRDGFWSEGRRFDHIMWSILVDEYRARHTSRNRLQKLVVLPPCR